jgi:hypothetical protein
MALTKVTKSGITDNSIDADKLEDGTILDADITPGTITNAKLAGSISNDKLANSSLTINGSSVSLGSSISAGALDWQAVITADGSTSTTGVAGRGYFIDTTSAAHTFTLPSSPTIGDTIAIVDYAGTFATNKLTIARNGNNIQGVANNSQLGTNRASITLVYVDATKGWVYQNESNVADLGQVLFLEATGGTVLTNGDFKTHVFTGDGCFSVSQIGNAPTVPTGGPSVVDYLVVAGGGGAFSGAGAGAGGFRTFTSLPGASPLNAPVGITVTATTYPITVGGGGASGNCSSPGPGGSPSTFSTITSAGGGRSTNGDGGSGGSGGSTSHAPNPAGAGNTPPVSPPQGNPGGSSQNNGKGAGGGAGAAGGNASPGVNGPAGSGGVGSFIVTCFFGPTAPSYGTAGPSPGRWFAGGGGGSTYSAGTPGALTAGSGGAGGGGAGGATVPAGAPVGNAGNPGTINTGGGGGGLSTSHSQGPTGGSGGSGIVLIRYKFQ